MNRNDEVDDGTREVVPDDKARSRVSASTVARSVDEARSTVLAGLTVAFSTDTVWGLGVRHDDAVAVQRVYRQKGRSQDKVLQVLCADASAVARLVDIPSFLEDDWRRVTALWPGALTLVVPAAAACPAWLVKDGKVGIRMPNSREACDLLAACGGLLAATSLNRSGEPSVYTFEAACDADIADVVLPGPDAGQLASTVFDLPLRRVLREGALSSSRLLEALA
ncbi:L-threonylcarbamoyladenylate synthase [Deinococcus yavapaiensis]|uniref:L-threonylcarbamoyladenylate synthase n=1 Tax=Deinococcus yavapaiensis KR-236 TaxID=694435 RepID=A0A318S2D3_9DEIO|nr:L-threonylcarbamoyladenylate synthase [Deinococcus yavapaiensis]PYE49451.1 translation factor SUA5 [Deinococcus yavapaiensis KR-236]